MNPAKTTRTATLREENNRAGDDAFRAIAGCTPRAIPLAKAAAIATAGSLMALFATSRVFRRARLAERNRTKAFQLPRICSLVHKLLSVFCAIPVDQPW